MSACKIFFVDDDIVNRTLYPDMIEDIDGVEVDVFESGEEVIARVGDQPDILVLDYNLQMNNKFSPLNGMDVFKVFREKSPSTKVIVYSSVNSVNKEEMLEMGLTAFVEKDGDDIEEIVDYIREIVEG